MKPAKNQTPKQALLDWLDIDLQVFFTSRSLQINTLVANCWGRMIANAGRPLPAIDSLIAATALQHNLVLVTRNVKDVAGLAVEVFNPWSE